MNLLILAANFNFFNFLILCILCLVVILLLSGIVYLAINKLLKDKANFIAVFIGSILLTIISFLIIELRFLSTFQIDPDILYYTTWTIAPILGGFLGYLTFKSIKNSKKP